MDEATELRRAAPTFVFRRLPEENSYSLWRMDLAAPELFVREPLADDAHLAPDTRLLAIGGYLLAYSMAPLGDANPTVSYKLLAVDPASSDPLNGRVVQAGSWSKNKFWCGRNNYTWNTADTDFLQLIPISSYVLCFMPTPARASYLLFNFDPSPTRPNSGVDPLSQSVTPQDAFPIIGVGSELTAVGDYVLERVADAAEYRLWSFDPQEPRPLAMPPVAKGARADLGSGHRLLALGEDVLNWEPATGAYTLWRFDPLAPDPFVAPLASGVLPEEFRANAVLTAFQPTTPVDAAAAATPGTMDFMRDRIEHVVVYMLESRSFDSVLGWLYEKDAPTLNFLNAAPPFDGASSDYSNEAEGRTYPLHKFNNGVLSADVDLVAPSLDPFHGTPDAIRQQYSGGFPAYWSGAEPDMGGFVASNASGAVMVSFTPEQLPVLNGLARAFAVSDAWFSALPGGTDSNRGFALSGSSYNVTTTYEGQPNYTNFANEHRRPPIWKTLWSEGFTDWKIYYTVQWYDEVFTYHLFLRNQIPSVDANPSAYVGTMTEFLINARTGKLPKFSFLEPAWIAPTGATSYHPGAGADLVPGEVQLNMIYEALRDSPNWEKTALVITFSKGGGLYDHVPPPAAVKGWPKDAVDGFAFDRLGPRVPAIVVSPLVEENTVFRSPSRTPLSATSLAATLLDWHGVPRARWGLGDRVPRSPTFEAVFTRAAPRADKPLFPAPYDKSFPPEKGGA